MTLDILTVISIRESYQQCKSYIACGITNNSQNICFKADSILTKYKLYLSSIFFLYSVEVNDFLVKIPSEVAKSHCFYEC
jgi:hypothetical protein